MSRKHISNNDIPDILLKHLSEDPSFKPSNYLNDFQFLETDLERLNITYKLLEKYDLLPVLKRDEKNDTRATKQWTIGQKLITDKHYLEALECCTRCVTNANSKEALASAYANRSKCLYKMKLYRECITDIDRALTKNYYSRDLRPKLLDRRKRAENSLEPPRRFYQEIPKIPPNRRNPTIQCARNCVEIAKNRRFGRHIIATRDIQIGEVICVEKCYASLPKGSSFLHCHHCMELCYNPIPCSGCTLSLYCSEDCKNKAKKQYHKYLCPLVLTLLSYGLEPLHFLALKVVILGKDEIGKEVCDGVYRSDRYKEVAELMSATKEMPAKDLLEKSSAAAMIYHLVKYHTSFFQEHELSEFSFKNALLLQVQIIFLNHLTIYENIQNEKQYESEMFGIALYPFSSLFNHSCHANVNSVQYGSINVLRAKNTIPKGSQLFINYGVQYDNFPLELRQKFLSIGFFFTCKCEACEHNWMICGDKAALDSTMTEDLKLTKLEILFFNKKLAEGDVEAARIFLQHIIPHFKKCEQSEPFGNAWKMKDWISTCYNAMGNRRRI